MKNVITNYGNSWLMGIDPVATGGQLRKVRRDHGITQEFLHPGLSSVCGRMVDDYLRFRIWYSYRSCMAVLSTS